MATNTRASFMPTLDDEEQDALAPASSPPRVTVARPAQRSEDVFDFKAAPFDPRQLTNPVARRMFGGDIARATKAGELQRREQEADDAERQRAALAAQKAAEKARREQESEALKASNSQREAQFRTHGVDQYVDAYGVVQPVRHPDGRPRFQVGADGYRVVKEGKDPAAGHFRVKIDAYGDQLVEDANEYRTFEDEPSVVYRGGKDSSKKPLDRTGWEKFATVDEAADSDSPALRGAGESARAKLRESLVATATAEAERERVAADLGLQQWRQGRTTAAQRIKEIEAQESELLKQTGEKEGGFLGINKKPTMRAEAAQKRLGELQAEAQKLRDTLGPYESEDKAIETDPAAAALANKRALRSKEIEAFKDLARVEKDPLKAARKFRELLPESERATHPILTALKAEKERLGLREPGELAASPQEREAQLAAWEKSPEPAVQQLAKEARALESKFAAAGGTGVVTPEQRMVLNEQAQKEADALQAKVRTTYDDLEAKAKARQAAQAKAFAEKRVLEARGMSAGRALRDFSQAEGLAMVPGMGAGAGLENAGLAVMRAGDVLASNDSPLAKAVGSLVPNLVDFGQNMDAVRNMEERTRAKVKQGMEPNAARAEARREVVSAIEAGAGGPDMASRWAEHASILDGSGYGISPATREFIVSDAVYRDPKKLAILKRDIREKKIPGLASDAQVSDALTLIDRRVAMDEAQVVEQARKLPGWEDARKAAGDGATDAQVLEKWKSSAGIGETVWNALRKLGGGAVGLVEGALGGASLWARDKANAVGEWAGLDFLKTSPDKFADIVTSFLDPRENWAGAVGGRPNPRLDGVLSETANTIGQQLPGWLAAYALAKVPGGKKAAGRTALAQSILMGTTYGLQNAASNYQRIFEANVTRDENGNVVAGAEEAHRQALEAFNASFAVGVSELAPLESVFSKIPAGRFQTLVKILKETGAEVGQEMIATKLNNVVTQGHSGAGLEDEELSPESLMAMTLGMGAVIAPAIALKSRKQAQWLTKNASALQQMDNQATAVPAAWLDYTRRIAPTPAAINLGALDPEDPVMIGAVEEISDARAAVGAAKSLEDKVTAYEGLATALAKHAPTLDVLQAEGPKSANLNEVAGQIDAIAPETLISRLEDQGITPSVAAQYVGPQYVQRQKDRATGLVKLATGRADLMTKAETAAVSTDHLGNAVELVYDQDGSPIIEERARQGLISLVPSAAKLFPATEAERKQAVAREKRQAEAAKTAGKPAAAASPSAPPPLQPVEEADAIPMGPAPGAPAAGPMSPEQEAAVSDLGNWLIGQGIPAGEAAALATEFVPTHSQLAKYSRAKHFVGSRTRLADFVQARGWALGVDGQFVRTAPASVPQSGKSAPAPAPQSGKPAGKPEKPKAEPKKPGKGEAATPPPNHVTRAKVLDALNSELADAPKWLQTAQSFVDAGGEESGGMWVDLATGALNINLEVVGRELDRIPSEKHAERLRLLVGEEITHQVQIAASKRVYARAKNPGESFPAFLERYYTAVWKEEFSTELKAAVAELRSNVTGEADWQRAMEAIRMLVQQRKAGTQSEALRLFVSGLAAKTIRVLKAMLDVLRDAAHTSKGFGERVAGDIAAIESILTESSSQKVAASEADTTGLVAGLKGLGNAMTNSLYTGLYDALVAGKSTFSGVKDPILTDARPAFDAGLIKSPDDLKRFYEQGFPTADEIAGQAGTKPATVETLATDTRKAPKNVDPEAFKKRVKEEAASAAKLPQPTDADWREREKFVGEDFAGPPNSVAIQVRDLQSRPIGDGLPVVLPLGKDIAETVQTVKSGFGQLIASYDNASMRESVVKVLDENGRAVFHIHETFDNGWQAISQRELERWRKERFGSRPQGEAPAASASIDAAANEAATSPKNALPEPTQAQKEAGNYKLGHIKVAGLDISIENPAGSERKGVDKSGKAWSVKMRMHYGYIKRTEAVDGDHIDVFVARNIDPEAVQTVFIVDQIEPETGKYDEPKVILGAKSEEMAKRMYLANYSKGWKGLGGIKKMGMGKFKEWLNSPESSKPASIQLRANYSAEQASSNPPPAGKKKTLREELEEEITRREGEKKPAKKPAATADEPARPTSDNLGNRIVEELSRVSGRGIPLAAAAKVAKALREAITEGKWTDFLRPDNKNSRKVFAIITGVRLPAGLKDSQTLFVGKPFPVLGAEPAGATTPPAAPEAPAGPRPLGMNARGNPLFEDDRGVRSYVEGGFRITESVGFNPGGGIDVDVSGRGRDYLTSEEFAAKQGRAQAPAATAPAEQPAEDPAQARLKAAMDKLRAIKDKTAGDGGKLASASLTGNPAFYSRLEAAVDEADFGRSQPKPPAQWAGVIQKWAKGWSSAGGSLWRSGISADELKWSGVIPWLAEQKRMLTKADVLQYLRSEGRVTFEEVMHRDGGVTVDIINRALDGTGYTAEQDMDDEEITFRDPDGEWVENYDDIPQPVRTRIAMANAGVGPTKYRQYALPGGENYREVVLAMPAEMVEREEPPSRMPIEVRRAGGGDGPGKYYLVDSTGEWGTVEYQSREEAQQALTEIRSKTKFVKWVEKESAYTSGHFDNVPNYVAHYRAQDFGDGTLIEEMQSDRHQDGRKKGYREDYKPTVEVVPLGSLWGVTVNGNHVASPMSREDAEIRAKNERTSYRPSGIPDAPYRKTWPLALFKRALREAVETGNKWIGWPAGSVVAERFDLSDKLDSIQWDTYQAGRGPEKQVNINVAGGEIMVVYPNSTGEVRRVGKGTTHDFIGKPLDEIIGKEIAQKIMAAPNGRLEDEGLSIGGEGMQGFYDDILPKEVGRYVRQWGATVEKGDLTTKNEWVLEGLPFKETEWQYGGVATKENAEQALDERRKEYPSVEWRIRDISKQDSIWRVAITPQMRKSVAEQGQALFSAPVSARPDPETLAVFAEVADAAHGAGITTPEAFARVMVENFGDAIGPRTLGSIWSFSPAYDPDAQVSWSQLFRDALATPAAPPAPAAPALTPPAIEATITQDETGSAIPGERSEGERPTDRGGAVAGNAEVPADAQDVAPKLPRPGRGGRRPTAGAGQRAERPVVGGTDDGAGGPPRGADEAGAGNDPVGPVDGAPVSGTARGSGRGNYWLRNPEAIVGGGPKARFRRNQEALEVLETLKSEGREPTQEELDKLAAYTGWGAFGQALFNGSWDNPAPQAGWERESDWLREYMGKEAWESAANSILNAHYTDPVTVTAMWDMVRRLGFRGGRVQEPGMGIGNFYSLMPRDMMERSMLNGVELDTTTAAIAQMLHPKANIAVMGYQDTQTADNFYDLTIGNWPFSELSPPDRKYNRLEPSLHDYYFLKALDKTRPGGLVIGITSSGTMDKKNPKVRRVLANKGRLVGAIRLPTGAFGEYAGTAVVTDILIFQKYADGETREENPVWIESQPEPQGRFHYNGYYHVNPGNILGEITYGHGTTFKRAGMIVNRPADADFLRRLSALTDGLPEIFRPWKPEKQVTLTANTTGERRQKSIVVKNGDLFQVEGEHLAPVQELKAWKVKSAKETAKRLEEAKGIVAMREAYDALMVEYRQNRDTEPARVALRREYDRFKKAHGNLRDSRMLAIFEALGDPMAVTVVNLEDAKGAPRAILERDTMRRPAPSGAGSIEDAYAISRNNSMDFDLEEVAKIAGVPVEQAKARLIELNQIFETPTGTWEARDEYLAGNVRRKLREAQDAAARGMDMTRNLRELEAIQPEEIPYFDIEVKMGAAWIPIADYKDFIATLINAPSEAVEISQKSAGWGVKVNERYTTSEAARTVWGHPAVHPNKMFQAAMDGTSVTVTVKDSEGNTFTDKEETEKANGKVEAIREELAEWLWRDPERTARLITDYNEVMNSVVTPQRDGSHLRFEGLALKMGDRDFEFRKHQTDAVWRFIQDGRGMAAHEVGTGKTFTMAGLIMEGRRLGRFRKPIVFAHNANHATVVKDFQAAYPGGKFLYIDSLNPAERESRMRQIAMDDWDAIVVPHSLMTRFTLSGETMRKMAEDEIQAIEDELKAELSELGVEVKEEDMADMKKFNAAVGRGPGTHTAKDLARSRMRILNRILKREQETMKTNALLFEELGVDAILVDEAHIFKKIALATRKSIKGLSKDESGLGFALSLLTDYVKRQNSGRGVFLFTGTPVTNTLNEVYNMMKFVMDDSMEDAGIRRFDDWMNNFASSTIEVERTSGGTYEAVERLLEFINVPELARMAGQYFDVVQAKDMPEFKPRSSSDGITENPEGRPEKKVQMVIAEPSPEQTQFAAALKERHSLFKKLDGKGKKEAMKTGGDTPLRMDSDGSKSALDHRLYDSTAPDWPGSKINRAVGNIMAHWREHPNATQMVFMERGWNDWADAQVPIRDLNGYIVYDDDGKATYRKERRTHYNVVRDMVEKLVAQGVDPSEIAIFANMNLDSVAQRPGDVLRKVRRLTPSVSKEEFAALMREGKVKLAIGGTESMGTGVNAQTWMRAMHHLDAPWMPGSLEQRNGRGWRQGNKWNTVIEYRYFTEGSHDAKKWQTLLNKVRFIHRFVESLLSGGKRGPRVLAGEGADTSEDGGTADFEEAFAASAGDPRLLVRAKLEKEVQKLERRRSNHLRAMEDARRSLASGERSDTYDGALIERLDQDIAAWADFRAGDWEMTVDGQRYTTRPDAEEALKKMKLSVTSREMATLGPFKVMGQPGGGSTWLIGPSGESRYVSQSVASMEATLRYLPRHRESIQEQIATRQKSRASLNSLLEKPFGRQEELDKKKESLAVLVREIQASPTPAPSWLRYAAPTGSLVYLRQPDGTLSAKDVAAHRWDADGYWILVNEEDSMMPVRYSEALDETGVRMFEDMPFTQPPTGESAAAAPEEPETARREVSPVADLVANVPIMAPAPALNPSNPSAMIPGGLGFEVPRGRTGLHSRRVALRRILESLDAQLADWNEAGLVSARGRIRRRLGDAEDARAVQLDDRREKLTARLKDIDRMIRREPQSQKLAAAPLAQFPATITTPEALEKYLDDYVDAGYDTNDIVDRMADHMPLMQVRLPISSIQNVNPPDESRMDVVRSVRRAESMDDVPPGVVLGGEIVDGLHRYWGAVKRGEKSLVAYVPAYEAQGGALAAAKGMEIASAFKTRKTAQILMESEAQSGPFDGGCLICAKALQMVLGRGTLARIISTANDGQTEHYGLEADGGVYDAGGFHASHEKWIATFKEQEKITDRALSFDRGYDETSEIPDDPKAVKELSREISKRVDPILASAPLAGAPSPATDLNTWAGSPLRFVGMPEDMLNRGTVGLARWAGRVAGKTGDALKLPQAVAKLSNSRSGHVISQALTFAQKQLLPKTLLAREAAAWIQEARSAIAWSARSNEELMNVIKDGGASRFQEGFVVPPEGTNPDTQRQMARYFRGEIPVDDLPPAVHDWARKITKLWDERGKAMVDAGIMSWETYSARRAAPNSYFPHLYVTEELNNTGIRWFSHKLKMFLDRVKPQLSTAFYLYERNPANGQAVRDKFGVPKLLNHTGKTWRFNSAAHRDQWFEGFIRQETVSRIRRQGIDFSVADLDALALQSQETAALVSAVQEDIRNRWGKGEPTDLETLERAGLVTNLAYVVPKSLAQMDHDIALARLFKNLADNPQFTSDAPIAGYTEIPNDHRFGKLAGRWVEDTIAQEILELQEAPDLAWQIYDKALSEWKAWKTVYNPGTHFRNVLGNLFFADLAGVGVHGLQAKTNWRHYRDAWKAMKGDLPEAPLPELFAAGVLGGDFASAELQGALNGLPFDNLDGSPKSPLEVFLGAPWRTIKGAARKARSAYELEDAVFKVAAYLKARREGMSVPDATAHVRRWFPYYDQVGRSTTIRFTKRFTSPFLSFMQEAVRIGGQAMLAKPITFAKWLAMPSLMSAMSRYALGMDDDDWEAVERNMRGQVAGNAVFSALLPWTDDEGRPAQWDLTNVIPYADMLGQRMERVENVPMWSAMIHKYFLSGPVTQLAIAWGLGYDPFQFRPFEQPDMTQAEVLAAQADYTGGLLLPPLTPFVGTADLVSTFTRPDRAGRFLEKRSTGQELVRKTMGFDIRSALPGLYKSAEAWRKENGLPEPMDFKESTLKSRVRREVYSALVNGDVEALAENLVQLRERAGDTIRTPQDINRLFYYRDPGAVIQRKRDRDAWIQSLSKLERDTLNKSRAEFERAKRAAPALIRRAEDMRPELKAPVPRIPLRSASTTPFPQPGPSARQPAGMTPRAAIMPA
jgi:N12 class adenine-specific DNA methylase